MFNQNENQQLMREENERREERMRERFQEARIGKSDRRNLEPVVRQKSVYSPHIQENDRDAAMAVINRSEDDGAQARLAWRDEANIGSLTSPYPRNTRSFSPESSQHLPTSSMSAAASYSRNVNNESGKYKSILKKSTYEGTVNLSDITADDKYAAMKNYAQRLSNRNALKLEQESSSRWKGRPLMNEASSSPNSRTV